MGYIVISLTTVKRNKLHSSSLAHHISIFITGGYQVCQAQFPLCKSILTTSLPITYVFSFYDYFLHHFPRDRHNIDQPTVAQIFLIAILEEQE